MKDYKEPQVKHEQVCGDLKSIKECRAFSVALESCRKELKHCQKHFDEKVKVYENEIMNLNLKKWLKRGN